ncbi:MAG: hypothetical protein ACFE89_10035 [Candidatus Hodarchaeota archaeon]
MRRLAEQYELLDIDPMQWVNLLSLLPELTAEKGILYLLFHGSEIIQAFHSLQGIRPDLTGPFSTPSIVIQQLQQREEVDAVILLEQGLAVYLLAKMQGAFAPEMDIMQFFEVAQESIEEEKGRRLFVWPDEFWDKGTFGFLGRIHKLIEALPLDFVLALAVFEENRIWASLIIQRSEGQIRRITTSQHLESFNLNFEDWQTEYIMFNQAVTQLFGRPNLGIFTDDETLRFLIKSESPLEFLRQAYKKGQIIIDPIPPSIRNRLQR